MYNLSTNTGVGGREGGGGQGRHLSHLKKFWIWEFLETGLLHVYLPHVFIQAASQCSPNRDWCPTPVHL